MKHKSTKVVAVTTLTALSLAAIGLAMPGAAAAATTGAATGCATPLLDAAQQAVEVIQEDATAFASAAVRNGKSVVTFRSMATLDDSLWLDICGKAYYDEPLSGHADEDHHGEFSEAPAVADASVTATRPLSETFELQSKPGASRTVYLDFTGGTYTGTAWNTSSKPTIVADPYSIDADLSTFNDAERTQIQIAWQIVAEDYAPFDVNVTTKDLGDDAITRSGASDYVFGTRVAIAYNPNNLQSDCGCGGRAYVNVFSEVNRHAVYQPAWVFTKGVGTGGKNIAEAASHEAGHNFGLSHHGTASSGYYGGHAPWAPIMGVGYSHPVSQWSHGEYSGANNSGQDDVALIAKHTPVRVDDHGTLDAPTALVSGQTVDGVIETRADVDAFRFAGSGQTTVSVTPADGQPNLDVQLTIRDAQGTVVATVDPAVAEVNASKATGLDASWTATLPAAGATYTASVDGIGTGSPLTQGKYNDYGSLGNYQITLTSGGVQPPATPLSIKAGTPAAATVRSAYSATLATASGGTAPYSYTATGLPPGLTLGASNATASGTPTAAGAFDVTVTAKDATGATANTVVRLTVNPAPQPATAVAAQSFSGKAGVAQNSKLVATGGDGTYAWTVASGTVPPGLTLSPAGVLSGTPTTAGTFTFGATATSAGTSATGTITVTIAPATTPPGTWTWSWSWSWSSGGGTTPTPKSGVSTSWLAI